MKLPPISTLLLFALAGTASAQDPWINEIHYDNADPDVGEFVEIAGPSFLNLDGWTLSAYNGGTGMVYDTVVLTGRIPYEEDCSGTLSFSFAGALQDGAPDGICLADDGGTAIEFISYEGVFTGTDGPAMGMLSVDIGVSETGADAAGMSLQRTGTGSAAGDFTWTGPAAESPGAKNAGQTFDGGPAASVASRNGGTNSASYAVTPPILGGSLTATVDLTTTGHSTAYLFAFSDPFSTTLGGGQTLLCFDLLGAGELFSGGGIGPLAGPSAMFNTPITPSASLCGRTFYTQALHIGGVFPYALSNAQDLTFGH